MRMLILRERAAPSSSGVVRDAFDRRRRAVALIADEADVRRKGTLRDLPAIGSAAAGGVEGDRERNRDLSHLTVGRADLEGRTHRERELLLRRGSVGGH